jgi:hypothetical protein
LGCKRKLCEKSSHQSIKAYLYEEKILCTRVKKIAGPISRLDTGLVVAKLKEARILVQNSPNVPGLGTPYRLSDILISSPGEGQVKMSTTQYDELESAFF